MALSRGKKIGWVLLGLGIGGTLLFIMALLVDRRLLPLREGIWLWPILSTTLAVVAAFSLRRHYREDPSPDSRWFHFSLGIETNLSGFPRRTFLPFLRATLPCLPVWLLLRWLALRGRPVEKTD